jgi:hypothetical protein
MALEDDAIQEWAATLQGIYDERTAGDGTFVGTLASFLIEIDRKRKAADNDVLVEAQKRLDKKAVEHLVTVIQKASWPGQSSYSASFHEGMQAGLEDAADILHRYIVETQQS